MKRSDFFHPTFVLGITKFMSLLRLLQLLGICCVATVASAQHVGHEHSAASHDVAAKRVEANYRLTRLSMVRQDGKKVVFPDELDDGRPVVLQFIYTSCTAICPVTSRTLSQMQEKLGAESSKVHMISISIDPEYDTPPRLVAYAKKFGAGPQWHFYTGSVESSVALQKSFEAYRGDKMNHIAVTFMRPAPGKSWVRLEGLRSADDLIKEYRSIVGKG